MEQIEKPAAASVQQGRARRQRLVVFDLAVLTTSPAGSCVLRELLDLSDVYDVTLFSSACDSQLAAKLSHVHVWVPAKPLFLRYWIFQILALLRFWYWRLRNGRPDLIQSTQGQFMGADVVYAHFCHRAYLNGPWRSSPVRGVRRFARFLNHKFNSLTEGQAIRNARFIVVPSEGLAREIRRTYQNVSTKIVVLANPVDCESFSRRTDFRSNDFRKGLGFKEDDCVFAFMALGDFARKGLGIIIEAIARLDPNVQKRCKLLVIGGNSHEIETYREKCTDLKITNHVQFVGFHADPKPFLWCADVFCFPSSYEIFSLAILQAAAAGLPVIVPAGLYGAEEFVVDSQNGWFIERTPTDLCRVMTRVLTLGPELQKVAQNAQVTVLKYGIDNFKRKWTEFYLNASNQLV